MKSAQRVAEILKLVGSGSAGLTLADVARALGLPRSSAHALLVDMSRSGLLEVRPGSEPPRYEVGLLVFEVGSAFLRQRNLADEAQLVVDRLAETCDENAHLAVLDGRDVIYLAKAESTNAIRVASYVGRRLPANATALGKVLLAHLDTEDVIALYRSRPPEALTDRTISKLDELLVELRRVRADGFAFDDEECEPKIQCLAVPVFDSRGMCVAALSISIPMIRMTQLDRTVLYETVQEHADALSLRLGGARTRRAAMAG